MADLAFGDALDASQQRSETKQLPRVEQLTISLVSPAMQAVGFITRWDLGPRNRQRFFADCPSSLPGSHPRPSFRATPRSPAPYRGPTGPVTLVHATPQPVRQP